ncbi:MAG TPA: nitrous oxide-stimulated promoter family protein [Candidatus Hydrogenedentes bacterium]|nr:nitrous oxide-stimulated promoter family protein [Candidatus Hydrogenedentota bacterium]
MNDFAHGRLEREFKTIRCMIRLYCRAHHGGHGEFCASCADLLEYARVRLGRCPYQEGKTTCAKCPIHCYKPVMREQTRAVMRYAGPRMLFRHPWLTVMHYVDGLRRAPLGRAPRRE